MDKYQKYEQLAVQIECFSAHGTGCIFQPNTTEYTYVLTAKHCLIGKTSEYAQSLEPNKITITSPFITTSINVINYFLHNTLDIALIVVNYISDISCICYGEPKENKTLNCFGYPECLTTAERKDQKITSTLNFNSNNEFELIFNFDLGTSYKTEMDTVVGLSGSGIFIESNDDLTLVGILSRSKGQDAVFKSFLGVKASCYNELLEKNKLPLLIPRDLCSFENYISSAFNFHDRHIDTVLSLIAKEVTGITPWTIYQELHEKLFLPYDNKAPLDGELWIAWITFLTYLRLHGETNFDFNRTHLHLFYSSKIKRLEELVRYIFFNLPDQDFQENDCVILKHTGSSGQTVYLDKNKVSGILKKIDNNSLYEKGIHIDQPNFSKDISVLNIDYFTRKFANCTSTTACKALEAELKTFIDEVFSDVNPTK